MGKRAWGGEDGVVKRILEDEVGDVVDLECSWSVGEALRAYGWAWVG